MEDILDLQQQVYSTVDRTQKLIYTLHRTNGDVTIEVAAIDKEDSKLILCVPTQTNCAQACSFCHTTGLAGKVAVDSLFVPEILDIVRTAWRECGFAASDKPLLVSFMGVGEPIANQHLLRAMIALTGWASQVRLPIRFALSTMMPEKHLDSFALTMNALAMLKLPVKLHLSLHYTTDEIRRQWMPTAASIAASLSLLAEYHRRTGNPVEVHYTLISGVNDTMADLFRLKALLRGQRIPIKFLKYNPAPGDTNRSPDVIWTDFFRSEIEKDGIPTEWYDSPGADIAAACGMFLTDAYIKTAGQTRSLVHLESKGK